MDLRVSLIKNKNSSLKSNLLMIADVAKEGNNKHL
jgi:hypothetical protein